MTKIKEKFYKIFKLKPKYYYDCFYNGKNGKYYILFTDKNECVKWIKKAKKDWGKNNAGVEKVIKDYSIDNEMLLKIFCILSVHQRFYCIPECVSIKDFEDYILDRCIKTAERLSLNSVFAEKIYKLFEEKNNEL